MIKIILPSQLDEYTQGERELVLETERADLCLADVINELDKRHQGVAFRLVDEHGNIRRHIAMFIGEQMVRDLAVPVAPNARVQIVGALSGG